MTTSVVTYSDDIDMNWCVQRIFEHSSNMTLGSPRESGTGDI